MYRFPKVIEYTENGTKFRAEYDKEYDDVNASTWYIIGMQMNL